MLGGITDDFDILLFCLDINIYMISSGPMNSPLTYLIIGNLHLNVDSAAAAKSLQSCPTLCDPIDSSPPGSPALGFSRQEHWSGLPFPSPVNVDSREL